MTSSLELLAQRGFWVFRLVPRLDYRERRYSFPELDAAVRASTVSVRGWDFPHLDTRRRPHRRESFMEESTDWQHYVEFWRCYRSGQFISYVALLGEWRDRSKLWPPEPEWKAGRLLYAEDAVMSILEFLMFSSRWAAELGDGFGVDLRIEVRNTAGRRLGLGSSPGTVAMGGEAHAPDWKWTAMASFAELVADRRQLAADAALDLFSQFDWDAPADVIRAIQDKYAGTS